MAILRTGQDMIADHPKANSSQDENFTLNRANFPVFADLFLFFAPWRDFRQQHHAGQRQNETQVEKHEPTGHIDNITGGCIDECPRHRRQTGEQCELRGGIAFIGRFRDIGDESRRPQPDAERLETDDECQQQGIGAIQRQP